MSERKVLNKYYPPDFDPTKIPKLKQGRNRQYSIRIMSPFNMRCNTCGEYIYKGKKFNSRKETVEDETYLGLYIFRFYIKCPRCVAEIAFKTDPHNTDYSLEAGATRNFEALRTAELQAEKEQREKEEEEANNPMKVLENRTKASRQEMDMIETLEDLKQMNSRHAKLDHSQVIKLHQAYEEQLKRLQDEEDEDFVNDDGYVRRLPDPDEEETVPRKMAKLEKPTDFLTKSDDGATNSSQSKKLGGFAKASGGSKSTSKSALSMLVKRKQPQKTASPAATATAASNAAEKSKKNADNSSNGPKDNTGNQEKPTETKKETEADDKSAAVVGSSNSAQDKKPVVSGLGLLGDYSDSSESEGSSH